VGGGEVHAGFCWGKRKERNPLEFLDVVGRMILKIDFKSVVGARTRFI